MNCSRRADVENGIEAAVRELARCEIYILCNKTTGYVKICCAILWMQTNLGPNSHFINSSIHDITDISPDIYDSNVSIHESEAPRA